MKNKSSKCNHDINSESTSILIIDKFRTMTFPPTVYGACAICGESFEFIKNQEGGNLNYVDGRRNKGAVK